MFNDERINQACGNIYCRGILGAVVYALLFGVARALFLGGFRLSMFLTEAAIILTGAVILLVGLIRWGFSREERVGFERHTYYLTAGKVFVVAALAGYALSIPLRGRVTGDYPVNELILHLETLGCVYFFFAFKHRKVSFNYTFIDEPSGVYYRRVFLNIGKLAGILAVPFAVAALLDFGMHGSLWFVLAVLLSYIASVVGLGLDYLLFSVLEKMNYDEEFPRSLKKGTVAAFALAFGAKLVAAGLSIAQAVVLNFPLTEVGKVLAAFSTAINRWSYPLLIVTALALCFLMEQVGHSKRVRVGVCGYLTVQAVDLALRTVRTTVVVLLERTGPDPLVMRQYTDLLTWWSFLVWLLCLVFTCIMLYGLIRDGGASRHLWWSAVITVACQAVGLFLVSQNMTVANALVLGLGGAAALGLQVLLLAKGTLRGSQTAEDDPARMNS